MRRRSGGALIALGLMGLVVAGIAYGQSGNDGARASAVTGNELFVRTADGGTLRRLSGRRHTFRLTLRGLAGRVTVFTDRPQRKAGTESTTQFVKRWRSRGFVSSPPNAALVLSRAGRRQDVKVFELSRPRLSRHNGTLSFTARDLGDRSTTALSGFAKRADRAIPRRFTRATLFVDASAPTLSLQSVRFRYVYSGPADNPAADVTFSNQTVIQTVFASQTPGGDPRTTVGPGSRFSAACFGSPSTPCSITTTVVLDPAQSPVVGNASIPAGGAITATVGGGPTVPVPSGAFALK